MRSWLDGGRQALSAGQWSRARTAFEAALRQSETAEAFEGLAAAAWWLDDAETVLAARERAWTGYQQRGDRVAAARVATAIGEDCLSFRGEPAAARAWHERAAGLLRDLEPGPEHGWLEIARGDVALETRAEPALAQRHAELALEIGRALALPDLEMVARALAGAAAIAAGNVGDGLRLLEGAAPEGPSGGSSDHAAVAATCGYIMRSCNRIRDVDRAAQWCERTEELGRRLHSDTLVAICRTELADVQVARGEWDRAERELEGAARTFARTRPAMRARPLIRLAMLRRRQGWFDDARAILAELERTELAGAFDQGLVPIEQAALALDVGDASLAARMAETFVSGATGALDRLAALEVLVRAELAKGGIVRAEAAIPAMRAIVQGDVPPALAGAIRLADGLVAFAKGHGDVARAALHHAGELLEGGGALYDAARARIELAGCTEAEQDGDAVRELQRAWRSLAKMGLEPLRPTAPAKSPPPELSKRELEVLRWLAKGQPNLAIAAELHISEFTVKRHVQNILRKLDLPTRAAAAAFAARDGLG